MGARAGPCARVELIEELHAVHAAGGVGGRVGHVEGQGGLIGSQGVRAGFRVDGVLSGRFDVGPGRFVVGVVDGLHAVEVFRAVDESVEGEVGGGDPPAVDESHGESRVLREFHEVENRSGAGLVGPENLIGCAGRVGGLGAECDRVGRVAVDVHRGIVHRCGELDVVQVAQLVVGDGGVLQPGAYGMEHHAEETVGDHEAAGRAEQGRTHLEGSVTVVGDVEVVVADVAERAQVGDVGLAEGEPRVAAHGDLVSSQDRIAGRVVEDELDGLAAVDGAAAPRQDREFGNRSVEVGADLVRGGNRRGEQQNQQTQVYKPVDTRGASHVPSPGRIGSVAMQRRRTHPSHSSTLEYEHSRNAALQPPSSCSYFAVRRRRSDQDDASHGDIWRVGFLTFFYSNVEQ